MSVAFAHTISPHMSRSVSATLPPMDRKRVVIKSETEDILHKDPTTHAGEKTTPPQSDPSSTAKELPDPVKKDASNAEATHPLAPPPRPIPAQQNAGEGLDYFSTGHINSHFSREPNPFEQQFGNPSDAPKLLPPVASLTSPAPLADGASTGGYNWSNSLRSGPLSPAMLGGPVGAGDYFDPNLRGSFGTGVTPNESSLRTGLTPGGGGSMFPAPSPNSQALFQQIASGGATPSTLDFHRTALNVAAASKGKQLGTNGAFTQPEDKRTSIASMDPSLQEVQQPTYGQHDSDAANGLYMLAQAGNSAQSNPQFAVPQINSMSNNQNQSQGTSPNLSRAAGVGARGNSVTGSIGGQSEMSGDLSDGGAQVKPTTRSKGKRSSTGKDSGASNGRRKADDAPAKQPSAKKQKNHNVNTNMDMGMDGVDSEDEQSNIKEEQYHENGKKMTDEEKRKNFLERNRVAALKCRQRKKQWLANLQAKVEIFSSENDNLSAQVSSLREEIVGLKTLLLQHKDCPVSQNQGLGGYFQQQQDFNPHANPYGIGMQNGQQVMAGQRR